LFMAKMFYSTEEAATRLNLTPEKMKELVEQNKLREFRDGTRVMFKVDQVDRIASEAEGGSAGDSGGPIDLEPMSATGVAAAMASSDTNTPLKSPDSSGSLGVQSSAAGLKGGTAAGGSAAAGTAAGGSAAGNSKTGTSAPGVKVFGESEVQAADPRSQTQISSGVDESVSPSGLDAVGSGSGLLDLTRESDNTSLGAELLEEIYPGEQGASGKSGIGSSSSVFDQTASGSAESGIGSATPSSAAASDLGVSSAVLPTYPSVVESSDPVAGLFGGFALAAVVVMLLAGIVGAAAFEGYTPDWVNMLGSNFLLFVGVLVVITLLMTFVGFFAGRSGDR
jgi:excisionase family DNA binding protein